jgi:hypothetical protein
MSWEASGTNSTIEYQIRVSGDWLARISFETIFSLSHSSKSPIKKWGRGAAATAAHVDPAIVASSSTFFEISKKSVLETKQKLGFFKFNFDYLFFCWQTKREEPEIVND